MSDKLKSAYELAMEKLKRRDVESPEQSTAPEELSAEQKTKIAQIRRETEARLAEREILFKSERQASRGSREQWEQIEEAYRRDRERLLSRQEEQIRAVKSGTSRNS